MGYDWNKITKEKFKKLYYEEGMSDAGIANLYGVKVTQVRYKRNKFGISMKQGMYEDFFNNKNSVLDILNEGAKSRLLKADQINHISKVITRYAFRDGPIEDMHASGQLSQEDMKEINKHMANKIAGILKMISDGQWIKVETITQFYRDTKEWDEVEPDTNTIEEMFKKLCIELS